MEPTAGTKWASLVKNWLVGARDPYLEYENAQLVKMCGKLFLNCHCLTSWEWIAVWCKCNRIATDVDREQCSFSPIHQSNAAAMMQHRVINVRFRANDPARSATVTHRHPPIWVILAFNQFCLNRRINPFSQHK